MLRAGESRGETASSEGLEPLGGLVLYCPENGPEAVLIRRAFLALADGTVLEGVGFGAVARTGGEVVFNTGIVGYPESITDPSYRGQILCQTYPLIGNYGVDPARFESERPQIAGYIVSELCARPSHATSRKTLDEWLRESGVPGLAGVDTRALTKKLRVHGVMTGLRRKNFLFALGVRSPAAKRPADLRVKHGAESEWAPGLAPVPALDYNRRRVNRSCA
jgi:hypothetical protein